MARAWSFAACAALAGCSGSSDGGTETAGSVDGGAADSASSRDASTVDGTADGCSEGDGAARALIGSLAAAAVALPALR